MIPNKTKVLFIITQSELGGAQRWVFDMATNLDKSRYEIVVACGDNKIRPIGSVKSISLINRLEETGIQTKQLHHLIRNLNPLKDFRALVEIYHLIKKEKPDVLQLCSTKAGLLGSIAGKMVGIKKTIYRIGGWSFNDPRPRWQNFIFLWLEKFSAPLKDKIIVNSQKGYDEALQYKICPKEKLALIYNGIDLSNIMRSRYIRYGEKNGGNGIVIGCIANFYPTKGLQYLIEAANLLKFEIRNSKFEIHIVGDGQQRPLLESLIKKYQLKDQVLLAGQQKDPWQYFAENGGIDLFVIPSLKEGMPYVLLEAMALGLPIIATTAGGIPEIISDKENGFLVPPQNPQALAEAIEYLMNNPELRNKLSKFALKDVQGFTIQTMINHYEKVLT